MKTTKTVADLVPVFIQSREDRNLRATTLVNYGIWARWMISHWGHRKVAKIKRDEITSLANSKSRNHAQVTQCFFRWLIEERHLPRLFDFGKLPRPRRSEEQTICYLTPADTRILLQELKKAYRPGFILGLYAGLRPYEMCRIEWSSIHIADRRIKIEARVSKIRRPRMIEGVPPILWQLLKPYAQKEGRVMPGDTDDHAVHRYLHERGRVQEWSGLDLGHDVLRHTFATHYSALTGDACRCAKILGHYKLQTLIAHYDGVTTKAQARDYFRKQA